MNEGKQSSPLSFKQLPVGFEFPPTSYQLTEPVIAKYLEAVGETSDFLTSGIVPPLAIVACAMTALSQSFTVPPGSIHASQELEFLRVVPIGTSISCGGKIAQKLERGSLNLVILEINVTNQAGEKVMTGKATIAAPN
jgi:acyl dehydratase